MPRPVQTWLLVLLVFGVLIAGCSAQDTPAGAPLTSPGEITDPPGPLPTDPAPSLPAAPTYPLPATPPPAVTARPSEACTGACRRWRAVLAELDERRSRAYASGRPDRLDDVYVAGTAALRRDRAMLRAWSTRGVTVTDLRLELLAVEVLHTSRWLVRLRVVDQLRPATATLPQGRTVSLPSDRATARVLELRHVAGQWRIATSRRPPG